MSSILHYITATSNSFGTFKHLGFWQGIIPKLWLESLQNLTRLDAFVSEISNNYSLDNRRMNLLFAHGATEEWLACVDLLYAITTYLYLGLQPPPRSIRADKQHMHVYSRFVPYFTSKQKILFIYYTFKKNHTFYRKIYLERFFVKLLWQLLHYDKICCMTNFIVLWQF